MLGYHRHTPRSRPPSGSRHPPRSRHPPEQTPPGSRHPPEQTPPGSRHPPQSRHPPGADIPPRKQTPAYGQWAAGTHPTGMHSCYKILRSLSGTRLLAVLKSQFSNCPRQLILIISAWRAEIKTVLYNIDVTVCLVINVNSHASLTIYYPANCGQLKCILVVNGPWNFKGENMTLKF